MAEEINEVLNEYFPIDLFNEINKKSEKFKIISELGTFLTTSAYSLCVNIISKSYLKLNISDCDCNIKKIIDGSLNSLITNSSSNLKQTYTVDNTKKVVYCVNDSVHASFKWYDLSVALPIFSKPRDLTNYMTFYQTSVGGATCDSSDFIINNCYMPELEIGEYLIFKNMGSYTKTGATYFNDIKEPQTIFVSTNLWEEIKIYFSECDNYDGLLSSKLGLPEFDEKDSAEDTNYEEILNKIFMIKSN